MAVHHQSPWISFLLLWIAIPEFLLSTKTLYFLHSSPASWGSARDTCTRYGAHLVNIDDVAKVTVDVSILDLYLGWDEAYQNLGVPVWTGLYRPDPSQPCLWHGCGAYRTTPATTDVESEFDAQKKCAHIDDTGTLNVDRCDRKLPYICQMDEGSCWFLPIQGKKITDEAIVMPGLDQGQCAKECKNKKSGYRECWGMSHTAGQCHLFLHQVRHAYIRYLKDSLEDNPLFVTFLKICVGGEVTHLKPNTVETTTDPEPENCTHGGDVAMRQEPECYCDCDAAPVPMDPEEKVKPVEDKADELKETLQVSTTNISSSVRKLNSATDDRSSSKSMGLFGIAMLSMVFGGLILLDMNIVIDHVTKRMKSSSNVTEDIKKE